MLWFISTNRACVGLQHDALLMHGTCPLLLSTVGWPGQPLEAVQELEPGPVGVEGSAPAAAG